MKLDSIKAVLHPNGFYKYALGEGWPNRRDWPSCEPAIKISYYAPTTLLELDNSHNWFDSEEGFGL